MKRLYLLRHAHSPTGGSAHDKQRPLSPDGIHAASLLGSAMKKHGYTPEMVICSSATRTRQTFETLSATWGVLPDISYQERLYNGGAGDYLDMLQHLSDSIQSVLLVGHNPSVHALASMLNDESDTVLTQKLISGYHPATLSVFDCPCDDWAELAPYQNKLIFYGLSADF